MKQKCDIVMLARAQNIENSKNLTQQLACVHCVREADSKILHKTRSVLLTVIEKSPECLQQTSRPSEVGSARMQNKFSGLIEVTVVLGSGHLQMKALKSHIEIFSSSKPHRRVPLKQY